MADSSQPAVLIINPTGVGGDGATLGPARATLDPAAATDPNARATWGGKLDFLLSAVGLAVGLGNVWRFPYLCYQNGGGAFLIPYGIMLVAAGLPLYFLELAFGQYASLGPITIWRVCPLFKGVGYTMVMISLMVGIYYQVIIGFTVFYFFASFQTNLPWTSCDHYWNTPACNLNKYAQQYNLVNSTGSPLNSSSLSVDTTTTSMSGPIIEDHQQLNSSLDNITAKSPAEEFWDYYVLDMTEETNISNIGHLQWHVTLCFALSWVIVFLCIMKGIKSSGKVVYFTATFPYAVLIILFIRGVTLPGASEGIKYYLFPHFDKMAHPKVWKDAAVQILYSLGPGFGSLLTMGSYNKFHNNCHRDAIIVALINCGTSVFAGFVIFSVLGYMAQEHGVPIDKVVSSGPGLAFIAYPEALAMMPGSQFWSACFFFMLFTLGLDSQFAGLECIVTGCVDEWPRLYKYKTFVTFVMCFALFLLGLPCVTQGGMFVVEILDKFSTSFPLLIVTALECIILAWIYGWRRFRSDIEAMIGFRINYYWIGCWLCCTPLVICFILVFSCVEYEPLTYAGYVYPAWAEFVGWMLSLGTLSFIPAMMIIKLAKCVGSCQNFWWVVRGPSEIKTLNLRCLIVPSDKWGPALQENRTTQLPGEINTSSENCVEADNAALNHREDMCFVSDNTMYSGSDEKVLFTRNGHGDSYI